MIRRRSRFIGHCLKLLCGFWFGLYLANSYANTVHDAAYTGQLQLRNCSELPQHGLSHLRRNNRPKGNGNTKKREKDDKWIEYLSLFFKDFYLHESDNRIIADNLSKKVRVHCSVYIFHGFNARTRAQYVMDTWGKRCNKIVFFSDVQNDRVPTIELQITSRAVLSKIFYYTYQRDMDNFDWFIGAADDTYVIMENLRYFLSGYNSTDFVHFGHHNIIKMFYYGGPSLVLSKGALQRFGDAALKEHPSCPKIASDQQFMGCLQNLGILAGNSLDRLGRRRFFTFDPGTYLTGEFPDNYRIRYSNEKFGPETMSDYSIAFHNLMYWNLYEIEWFVYHLRPHGLQFGYQDLN